MVKVSINLYLFLLVFVTKAVVAIPLSERQKADFIDDRPNWVKHVIGDTSRWKSLFIHSEDVNSDGYPDIVCSRYIFINPVRLDRAWKRITLKAPINNVVLLRDFDQDGLIDIFASRWDGMHQAPGILLRLEHKLKGLPYPGSASGSAFVWARNEGDGRFRPFTNLEKASGDYLQGAALFWKVDKPRVLLSFHQAGYGIQSLSIPRDPKVGVWKIEQESTFSQDEQISVADINYDKVLDIVTGTAWLDGAEKWQVKLINNQKLQPDRHHIADLDQNGLLDIVVGFEGVSQIAKLSWFQQLSPGVKWLEHPIAYLTGPMSLNMADLDDDKDIDIIVGEHNLEVPDAARLLWFENAVNQHAGWVGHLISVGEEHHNGALPVDLDLDGDLDVISIGWGHANVFVYENLSLNAR